MKPAKNDVVRVRVEPIERQAFERAARLSGLTLSAWLRMAARETAERRLLSAGEKPGWVK